MRPAARIPATGPSGPPVSVDEFAMHLRLDDYTDEADLLGRLLATAAAHVEGVCGRALVSREWDFFYPGWPDDGRGIEVDVLPVAGITGVFQTLAGGEEAVSGWVPDLSRRIPAAVAADGWPGATFAAGVANPVRLRATCGYGQAEDVPPPVRQAVVLLAAHWYEHREPVNIGNIVTTVPLAVGALLAPYRVRWL